MEHYNNYVTVDLDIIRQNYRIICKAAQVPVLAVVKANAYGHGALAVAHALAADAPFFGVSSMSEALELRNGGITQPILILGHTPVCAFPQAVRLGIRPAIFTYEDALALSHAACEAGVTAPFHFAVDTGMSRIGFQVCDEDADICQKIASLPNLECEGLFSHYATADEKDLSRAEAQEARFADFDKMLQARGICLKLRHIDNSAGILNFSRKYEMVRAGIILYGLTPSCHVPIAPHGLKPALSWHSHIAYLKTLEPGRQISYGGTFTTTRPTRVATIPVGYGDGYRRSLSGNFHVLIHGQKAPILGRVCMDQFMVDVTDIPQAAISDPVILLGNSDTLTITAQQMGEAAGSFNYETVCAISHRVPRVYLENGKPVHTVNYLLNK